MIEYRSITKLLLIVYSDLISYTENGRRVERPYFHIGTIINYKNIDANVFTLHNFEYSSIVFNIL